MKQLELDFIFVVPKLFRGNSAYRNGDNTASRRHPRKAADRYRPTRPLHADLCTSTAHSLLALAGPYLTCTGSDNNIYHKKLNFYKHEAYSFLRYWLENSTFLPC